MQKRIEKLLSEIAEKHNLPIEVIKEVYNSQWLFTKRQINSLEFKIIQLPAWGKFVPGKTKMEKYKEYYKIVKEDKELKLKIKNKKVNDNN